MVTSAGAYLLLVGATYAERALELRVSARHARALRARGGIETGRALHRAMVAFHAIFPAACAAEVLGLHRRFPGAIGGVALALVLAAQALRWWCVGTLGPRWTTRVIVAPGVTPVTRGPYRFVRHPNYLAVIVEIACLPLVHGAWLAALLGTAVNAGLLAARVRDEERALGPAWQAAFAGCGRFLPGRTRA